MNGHAPPASSAPPGPGAEPLAPGRRVDGRSEDQAPSNAHGRPTTPDPPLPPNRAGWGLLLALLLSTLGALAAGRYALSPGTVVDALLASLGLPREVPESALRVVQQVRLPRIALAAVVGAGLATCGAAMQSVFRNPLAEPQLLGISAGAAFGGVLGMMLSPAPAAIVIGAFVAGLTALVAVFWLAGPLSTGAGGGARSSAVVLVLAGLAVSAVCSAAVSLVKLVADPQNQLPAMVFWLMGSLAAAEGRSLLIAAPVILPTLWLLHRLRFQLMALSLGDEDARALGVRVGAVRMIALLAVGLITAAAVAVCGVVGWVGLVVPHLVRLAFGSDHRHFMINVTLAGATYLILVDTLARTATRVEIPLGVMTALLGAPMFGYLLRRLRSTGA